MGLQTDFHIYWIFIHHFLFSVMDAYIWTWCTLLGRLSVYRANNPCTLKVVLPAVSRVWWNVPVLGSQSYLLMRPCESEANGPLPCMYCRSFRLFKISSSDFSTVDMCRQFCTWAYEFLTTITTGVIHGVHKVVIRSSFGVIWRYKVS